MAAKVPPVVITFGGGVNSRKRPADIELDECVSGENFDLDLQQKSLRTRRPFDYVATTTNAAEIRGFGQLITRAGIISTLIQSGDTVYEWDGDTTFTSVGTVSASSRLRGPKEHNFTLSDTLILTDIEKMEVVKSWDGTTFQDFAHNITSVNLYAKYARVAHERLFLGNITTNSTATPHMIVASEIETAETLSISDKPSSALGLDSPFYILTPDLKSINGLEFGFGQFIISTSEGRIFILQGTNAFDFQMQDFYDGSAVAGNEGLLNIGNDIAMGLNGRIESLSGTINFGDVETDDATGPIKAEVKNIEAWTLAYDQRAQQVFAFPSNGGFVWVFHKAMVGTGLSPWSKWTTAHDIDFAPSTVFSIIDPTTSLRTVFMGDLSGNIYRLNGSNDQDGDTDDITVKRKSKLIRIDAKADLFNVTGWVDYRKLTATSLSLTFMWGGHEYGSKSLTFPLSTSDFPVYNGEVYYNGEFYYSGTFQIELRRQDFAPAGRGNYLQVEAEFTGEAGIEEIGLHIEAAQ